MKYPVPDLPQPPDLMTLSAYGPSVGRTKTYIQTHWKPVPGFPQPAGQLPARARHGGDLRELVYARTDLDAFRRAHDNLRGVRSIRLITGHDPGERVTLGEFAGICGISHAPDQSPGCPPAGPDGLWLSPARPRANSSSASRPPPNCSPSLTSRPTSCSATRRTASAAARDATSLTATVTGATTPRSWAGTPTWTRPGTAASPRNGSPRPRGRCAPAGSLPSSPVPSAPAPSSAPPWTPGSPGCARSPPGACSRCAPSVGPPPPLGHQRHVPGVARPPAPRVQPARGPAEGTRRRPLPARLVAGGVQRASRPAGPGPLRQQPAVAHGAARRPDVQRSRRARRRPLPQTARLHC